MPNYLIQKDAQNLIPFTGTSEQADVYARDFTVYTANSDGSKTLYGGPTSAYRADSRPKGVALTDRSDTTPSVVDVPYLGRDSAGNAISLVSGDEIFALSEVTNYVNLTATGTAFSGACEFAGYICTVAAGNITIYDNTSAAGTVIVPTTALVAGAFPIFGAGTNGKMALQNGCHVVLSGAATVNILVG